jgi:hypothetical protein
MDKKPTHTVRFAAGIAELEFLEPPGVDGIGRALDDLEGRPEIGSPIGLILIASTPGYKPSTSNLERVTEVLARRAGRFGTRIAVVVPTLLYYGLTRMAGTFAEQSGLTLRPFTDVASARAWLADGIAHPGVAV